MDWKEYNEARRCRGLLDDPFHIKALDKKLKEMENSEVKKQSYYYRNGIEVKDIIKQIYQFFGDDLTSWESACIYNIVKYLLRAKYKDNAQKDLDKTIVNLEWLKEEWQ